MESKYDFVERTKMILEQYDKFQVSETEYFDVTLLMNCSIGLLFVATEKYNNVLSEKDKEPLSNWGIEASDIKTILNQNNNSMTIERVCKHIRNSIAHYNFTLNPGRDKKIESIHFLDSYHNGTTFDYTVSVEKLKSFLLKVANAIIEYTKRTNDEKES